MLNLVFDLIVVGLAIVLFVLVHKIFDIYYFGCAGMGFTFLLCLCASSAIMSLIGGGVFLLFKSILWLVKWGLIIGGILVVVSLIISMFKNKTKDENESEEDHLVELD